MQAHPPPQLILWGGKKWNGVIPGSPSGKPEATKVEVLLNPRPSGRKSTYTILGGMVKYLTNATGGTGPADTFIKCTGIPVGWEGKSHLKWKGRPLHVDRTFQEMVRLFRGGRPTPP
ncbi:hypothetical protein SUGI_1481820 [Cryptomeria japonica]|uniref:Uncharacterized protein n=1 Tax=Cryptomeria japonica TaxID=3369 RepID=A0AAD3NSR2_CRYJA|nr:hypothetical protein SUGI_1424470 [Cryptomeria japonica]GLJ58881.1 hypothetical protein SUGI_1481820 [Cryptomeria japonica]